MSNQVPTLPNASPLSTPLNYGEVEGIFGAKIENINSQIKPKITKLDSAV